MDDLHIVDRRSAAHVSPWKSNAPTDSARSPRVVEQRPWFEARRRRLVHPASPSRRLPHPGDRFWLAKIEDQVVGVIGILHEGPYVARLSWFRVQPEWQQAAVVTLLMDQVYRYCWNQGYLKLVVPTNVAPCVIEWMLEHRGFQLVRRKRSGRQERLEYLVDLYYIPRQAS
jgi:GNAT superfamily N-acetyltransferase